MGEISPELVLVDPDLAHRARALLPDRHDWTIGFEPREREPSVPAGRHRPVTPLVAVLLLATAAVAVAFFRPVSQRPYLERPASPRAAVRADDPQSRSARLRQAPTPVLRAHTAAPAVSAQARRSPRRKTAPRRAEDGPKRPGLTVTQAMRAAIGKTGAWALSHYGPARVTSTTGKSCRLRWSFLRLTLFVTRRPGAPCSSGTVVGGAQGGAG